MTQTTSIDEKHYHSWVINSYEPMGNLAATESKTKNGNTVNGLRAS